MRNSSAFTVLLMMSLLVVVAAVRADSITLRPVADTSLFELMPDNNLGAQTFLPAGVIDSSGPITRERGLLRFDLSQIPANAKISNAALTVSVVSDGAASTTFEAVYLHRMLQPWVEGSKSGGPDATGTLGAPATDGETTWNHRQHPTIAWGSPGGATNVDFVGNPSAITVVMSISNYTFSSGTVTADVQHWVTNAASNFGWMIKSGIESTLAGGAAHRFGSREDAPDAPVLTVTYSIPTPIITTLSPLPAGTAAIAYSQTFTASSGTAPYTWALDSGALPSGLSLSSGGVLNGTPTTAGTFNFKVRVTDSTGITATNSFSLTINPAPLMITTTSPLPAAVLNVPYSQTLAASGGTPPYTWSVVVSPRTGGGLPSGFTLSSDGVFSGTLTNADKRFSSFEVQVADSRNVKAIALLTLPIESPGSRSCASTR